MKKYGFRVMSLKGEVIEEIRKRAKEENKNLSAFLSDMLKQGYSNKGSKEYGNIIATELKEYSNIKATELKDQIADLKKAVYSKDIATKKAEEVRLSLKDKEDIDTRIMEAVRTVFNEMR